VNARRNSRGVALLLVLWLVALFAALVGGFARTAQMERLQGSVLRDGVVAGEAARAGIEYAMVRVNAGDRRLRWVPDGRDYDWHFGGADVRVRIVDEMGKVDLNATDPALLAALFKQVGVDPGQAMRIAGAIVDWRDADSLSQPSGGAEDDDYAAAGRPYGAKDAPFESIAEVEQVLGMTPAIYARVEPFLTVFSGNGMPDASYAAPTVLAALGLDAAGIVAQRRRWDPANGQPPPVLADGQSLNDGGTGTYSIWSRARLRNGRETTLHVIVRSGSNGLPGSAYTALQWEEGTSPQ
jgi:general secretion pathway protein K